jgi:hypothetical protein
VTFHEPRKVVIIWLIWFLLPFAPLFLNLFLSWFRPSTGLSMVMQESGLQFKAMAAFAAAWFLLGLVPTLMRRTESLAQLFLVQAIWCALAGWYWGPTILAERTAPPASAEGVPCTFEVAKSLRQAVEIRVTSGPAVGVHFTWDSVQWRNALERSGKSVPGKVYKGKRNLWFANLD